MNMMNKSKKWITILLAFITSSAWAQLNPEQCKYYRVQNASTKRYVSVRDDVGSVNVSKKTADVKAVEMVSGFNNVVCDPATIIGLTDKGAGYFDFSAQGTSVSKIINKANVIIKSITDDSFLVYVTYKGSAGGMTGYANAYLTDPGTDVAVGYADSEGKAKKTNGIWYITPVDNESNNYFGVKMSLNANGKYYTTLYTDFPYQLPDGMKAYVVSEISGDKVDLVDIGSNVPAETPVILESNNSSPSQNKLQPLSTSVPSLSTKNLLKGVYFDHSAGGKHDVHTAFDKKTMRLLAVRNGEITLVNEGDAYISANTAYLAVSSGASSTLTIGKINSGSQDNPEDKMNHGTVTNPISVADAITYANTIGADASTKNFYVKGKISSIKYGYSAQYGTATYNISADGSEGTGKEFTVYGSYYFGNKSWQEGQMQIAVGDEVIVCGKIMLYGGSTPEFADKKSYLVSLNGKTSDDSGTPENPEDKMNHGTAIRPISVADAITYATTIGADASANDFYVKGKISSIKYEYSAKYGTATYNISDDGSEGTGKEFTVYGSYYFDNKSWQEGQMQIAVGDEVIVCGKIMLYGGSTPEFADKKNHLVSLNGKTSDDSGTPENPEDKMDHGTAAKPISVADAITYANDIGAAASANDFYVKGKICSIKYEYSAKYGTATYNISDDGSEGTGKEFTVYGSYYFDNKSWQEGQMQIAVGDEVIVCGKIMLYGGNTPEFADKKNHLVSLNGKTSDGSGPVENPEDKIDHGTADAPISVSEAIAAAEVVGTNVSTNDFYVKGKISSIKYEYSAQYGTATYNISEDGSEGTEFTVYNSYYFDNKAWQDGDQQITVGDEVIVCGKIINYNGNTPEFASKQNYLVSLNKASGIQSVMIDETKDTIYNLAGQRVTKVQKGIYLINGKKVLVK